MGNCEILRVLRGRSKAGLLHSLQPVQKKRTKSVGILRERWWLFWPFRIDIEQLCRYTVEQLARFVQFLLYIGRGGILRRMNIDGCCS